MQNRYQSLALVIILLWAAAGVAEHALAVTFMEFPIPTAASGPASITQGPDGAMWFIEQNVNQIGRITSAGVITEFPVPNVGGSPGLSGITAGPDGALWFTDPPPTGSGASPLPA